MSSRSVFAESAEGYVAVQEVAPEIAKLLENAYKYLSSDAQERMKAELGAALIDSITHQDGGKYLNHVVEAWLRTLYFKSVGIDKVLAEKEGPIAAGEKPIDLSEMRARLR